MSTVLRSADLRSSKELRYHCNPTLCHKTRQIAHLPIFFLFSECQHYQTLNSADRKVTHGSSPRLCDNSLGPAWFRFQGNAGTKMPTSCVSSYRCGTDATGWLNGPHTTVVDGKVTRQVCFSWSGCCTWSINIQVLNCGGYFVYFIDGTPPGHPCHLRYCGTD